MSPGRHAAPEPPLTSGVLAAETVSYARGGRVILDAVSLQVAAGESVAVVGPSGSGKSSLLALLARLETPDAGTVRLDGVVSGPIGLVLQGYGLVSVLTAAENVEVPLQSAGRSRAEIRTRARDALERVGLSPAADHLIEELSGGQQQRVAIARALAIDPSVILADELTAELDHEWKTAVVDMVLDIADRGGIVVLATHDPEIAERCTHVVRLIDGRLAEAG